MTGSFPYHRIGTWRFLRRLVGVCLLLAAGAVGAPAQDAAGQGAHAPETMAAHFVYHSTVHLNSVAVVGEFNSWNPHADPLVSDAQGMTWRTTLPLPLGRHAYKFVLNGSTWVTDPTAGQEEDRAGHVNSVIVVGLHAVLKLDGPLTTRTVAGPAWAANQPIYEVNLDVYGFPRGTALREYEKHLPVLKEMGIGLIWFMPLFPRGQKKAFGSPYAVRDYTDINPDFGTNADFRHLVDRAHTLGLHVLMDWVPNHTAWDNPLIDAHPEFYVKDAKGEIAQADSYFDVAQLDYGKPGQWNQPLWNRMRDDMAFWVREFGVDGFRCDMAGSAGRVPVEFWSWLRPQLDAVKPVFMLAEGDDPYLHPAFDMTYSWDLPPILWDVCAGRQPASAIDDVLRKEAGDFPAGAILMRFLDNHDWHGHADWGWGNGPAIDTIGGMLQVAPLMVLCTTLPGKPLLYNGQEMSYLKVNPPLQAEARYRSPVWAFYHQLLELYRTQPALFEGSFSKLASNRDDKVYAFVRTRGRDHVLVVVNLSDQIQTVSLSSVSVAGEYRDWFGERSVSLSAAPSWNLAPWAYRVYVSRAG